ncbi:MAG TPA: hypothetical protein VIU33_03270 [Nitrospiria bacterium]
MKKISFPYAVPFFAGVILFSPGLSGCDLSVFSGAGKPGTPIDRKAGPVRLGMTVEELEAATNVTEQTAGNPGLIEGERSFEIKRKAVPEGTRSIGLRFLNGRLYRITVDYFPNYFDDARWDALMEVTTGRYGKGWKQKMRMKKYPTELTTWEDEHTRMVLERETRVRITRDQGAKNEYNVLMVLLDMPVWRAREKLEGGMF